MTLEDTLFQFLNEHYDTAHPVLLGLSGGADSLVLLYLLKSYKNKILFNFGIAHVDHGWRSESADEAKQLLQLAADLNIPFHMKTLSPEAIEGNLEEACRDERLAFFTQLCKEYGYQAVILGHHADDQSETVLKKILEGKSLPYLCGMASISVYKGLNIWRPLINCSKALIKSYLEEKEVSHFEDKTNFDTRFLRARLRTKIIPMLSHDFGKEVSPGLCRIGNEAEELKAYLDAQLNDYTQQICRGPFGSLLDLNTQCPSSDFELRYLIRKTCECEGIQTSHHLIHEACQKIRAKTANCELIAKDTHIYIDRGRLFVMKKPLPEFKHTISIEIGQYSLDDWSLEVKEVEGIERTLTGWKDAWMGHMQVLMPPGTYFLKKGDASLSKGWTASKVPAFMRWAFPVIWSEKSIRHEFLTKRMHSDFADKSKQWLINIFVA